MNTIMLLRHAAEPDIGGLAHHRRLLTELDGLTCGLPERAAELRRRALELEAHPWPPEGGDSRG